MLTKLNNPALHLKEVLEQQVPEVKVEELLPGNREVDALVKIDNQIVILETKKEITPVNLGKILEQAAEHLDGENLMLIGEYITPRAKELLKEKAINYLDAAGNIYLKLEGLLIYVEGKANPSVAPRYKSRAFSKAGGAVVFQFLIDPKLVNQPQRLIAEYAGVSLGTIPKVFEGLQKEGYLIKVTKDKWELSNVENLLLKWTEVLRTKILPSKFLGNYKPFNISVQEMLDRKRLEDELKWGGEPAASLLTNHLVPEKYSLFVPAKKEFIRNHKLVPTPAGELEVYEKFWNHPEDTVPHVHPILIYAQLMASGESRNMETAQIILNEHIRLYL